MLRTKEHNRKISESMKGKKKTAAHKKAISQSCQKEYWDRWHKKEFEQLQETISNIENGIPRKQISVPLKTFVTEAQKQSDRVEKIYLKELKQKWSQVSTYPNSHPLKIEVKKQLQLIKNGTSTYVLELQSRSNNIIATANRSRSNINKATSYKTNCSTSVSKTLNDNISATTKNKISLKEFKTEAQVKRNSIETVKQDHSGSLDLSSNSLQLKNMSLKEIEEQILSGFLKWSQILAAYKEGTITQATVLAAKQYATQRAEALNKEKRNKTHQGPDSNASNSLAAAKGGIKVEKREVNTSGFFPIEYYEKQNRLKQTAAENEVMNTRQIDPTLSVRDQLNKICNEPKIDVKKDAKFAHKKELDQVYEEKYSSFEGSAKGLEEMLSRKG
jgi:hypothetical protein